MSIRDQLAKVIAVALTETNPSGLGAFDELSPNRQKQLLSRGGHAADAILARFGIVELPAPSPADPDYAKDMDDPFEFRGPWGTYAAINRRVEGDHGPTWHPEHARAEAAALLAAANRAEAQS